MASGDPQDTTRDATRPPLTAPPALIPPPPPLPARRTLAHQIQHGVILHPWMKDFAAWLIDPAVPKGDSGLPPEVEQGKMVERLTGQKIAYKDIRALRHRGDFIAYTERLEGSVETRAKERLISDYHFYVNAHRRGLEMALAEGDHRAVASFTGPILDRVIPKKQEVTTTAQTIVINVTAEQAAKVHGESMNEIVVETPELVDDATD